ncbi:AraC-like DNA-binding protein [Murinocardiopsis flavida]|uniref:AraC-like DNA-binding protein n=1 Tax=Murinocardiopsis flavida TaxID=645275 RepID=A0A2P8DQB7_9ACTN|nr:AraC family transcriptional regulator [Murinocardiopsis flavida]PSK99384.1 AraC-like DNA-binding protein [Murinocardiopsis flavida]
MTGDWARYWRAADRPLEAMHAHFERHVYHRHSHDAYSFGVTEDGAQTFRCRGAAHTSAAGMVMAFNPDDPHDGRAVDALGFTYRIVHIGPEVVADVLGDGAAAGLPLFPRPVLHSRVLAGALRRLHRDLLDRASALRRDESLADAVLAMGGLGAARPVRPRTAPSRRDSARIVARAREVLDSTPEADADLGTLAAAAGRSRHAVYRAFHQVYGIAPSDYQRERRLRRARRLIAEGTAPGDAAAASGFADQSHLNRWFRRYYGITPGVYARGTSDAAGSR